MKAIKIVPVVLVAAVVITLTSCSTGRYYDDGYSYGPQTNFSLILGPSRGMVVTRHPNGMYYYRAPGGYIYWRGSDNRYYLDRQYMNRSYYNHRQYNDWRRYNNRRRY